MVFLVCVTEKEVTPGPNFIPFVSLGLCDRTYVWQLKIHMLNLNKILVGPMVLSLGETFSEGKILANGNKRFLRRESGQV